MAATKLLQPTMCLCMKEADTARALIASGLGGGRTPHPSMNRYLGPSLLASTQRLHLEHNRRIRCRGSSGSFSGVMACAMCCRYRKNPHLGHPAPRIPSVRETGAARADGADELDGIVILLSGPLLISPNHPHYTKPKYQLASPLYERLDSWCDQRCNNPYPRLRQPDGHNAERSISSRQGCMR